MTNDIFLAMEFILFQWFWTVSVIVQV